jgi:hypothetical protein
MKGRQAERFSAMYMENENNMIYRLSAPHYQASIIISLLLFLTIFVPEFRAQGTWSTFTAPDRDFTISFPGAPERETKTTPQKPFTGQKVELFVYKNGEHSFIASYKDLSPRASAMDEEVILTEYERGLFVDGWLAAGRMSLPDGGFQYEAVMNLPSGNVREKPQARLQSRVYFRGRRRMYTLSIMSADANNFTPDALRFFSSLRFLKPPPAPPAPRRQVLTPNEVTVARTALRELRKLAAAESVAPSYDDYVRLLLAVKGEVDGYLADLPPGEVRDEIRLALEAYEDLQSAWNTTRGLLAAPVIGYEPQRTLIVKYGIPIDQRGDMPLMDFKGAVFTIFKAARDHIDRASALLRR